MLHPSVVPGSSVPNLPIRMLAVAEAHSRRPTVTITTPSLRVVDDARSLNGLSLEE